jgi:hypothetical protein
MAVSLMLWELSQFQGWDCLNVANEKASTASNCWNYGCWTASMGPLDTYKTKQVNCPQQLQE